MLLQLRIILSKCNSFTLSVVSTTGEHARTFLFLVFPTMAFWLTYWEFFYDIINLPSCVLLLTTKSHSVCVYVCHFALKLTVIVSLCEKLAKYLFSLSLASLQFVFVSFRSCKMARRIVWGNNKKRVCGRQRELTFTLSKR